MNIAATYQMQLRPRSGQFLMFVELTAIDLPIAETFSRLERLGYTPQLRYSESGKEVKLYALLRDEQFDPTQSIDDLYRLEERIRLFEAFPGSESAIYCPRGLPANQVAC